MFQPTEINALARTAHALVEGGGQGATIHALDTRMECYVIGGVATRLYPVGEAVARLRADMHALAGAYVGIVADTMGVWEDAGTVYLDLGTTADSLSHALAVAKGRGEMAIYDTEGGRALRLTGAYGIERVSVGAVTCGECGAAWDDDITPAGRCPWEYDH